MNDFWAFLDQCLHAFPVEPGIKHPDGVSCSDQVLHIGPLRWFASQCFSVVELGCRECISTAALLSGCRGIVYSIDKEISPRLAWMRQRKNAGVLPCEWVFIQGDTSSPKLEVPACDFLFIDDEHTASHLILEHTLWVRKASRFVGWHDTHSCAFKDVSGANPEEKGILPAIELLFSQYPGEYQIVYQTPFNNGLIIAERIKPKQRGVPNPPFENFLYDWTHP